MNYYYFSGMSHFIPKLIFKLGGWKVIGEAPKIKKYVLVAAPHTSNWDFVYGLCAWNLYNMKPRYLIKKEFFYFPLNILFNATGGLPVDRSKNNKLTDTIVEMFHEKDELIALVPPEGTRKKVDRWKTGFYYLAIKAQVPLVLGKLDYKTKTATLSEPFTPTGDIEADYAKIKEFYRGAHGKNPEGFDLEAIKPA